MLLYPHWLNIAKYLGATFLLIYGAQHFYQTWKSEQRLISDQDAEPVLYKVLCICLILTWLNPHVYLDTVILMGSISTQYANAQLYFALGGITASFVFFFSLGYAACYLQPAFHRPQAWKILDILIGCVMWSIAISLLNKVYWEHESKKKTWRETSCLFRGGEQVKPLEGLLNPLAPAQHDLQLSLCGIL